MRENKINYNCDDCPGKAVFKSRNAALAAGWAVAKDYKHCYCPKCAPAHRLGKAAEKNDEPQSFPPPGWEQLIIENLG